MSDNTDREAQPPYLSFVTVKNFVDGLRPTGVPDQIDRSLIKGQSGGTISYLLSAMKFFGLSDAAKKPTPRLVALIQKPDEEVALWAEAVREGYSFLFDAGFNVEAATDSQISERFREKGLTGATIRKCMSCFAAACDFAGIKISPHLSAGKRTPGTPRTNSPRRSVKKKQTRGQSDAPPPPEHHQRRTAHGLQEMLLAKFPEFDPSWSDELKKKWFEGFEKFMASASPTDAK